MSDRSKKGEIGLFLTVAAGVVMAAGVLFGYQHNNDTIRTTAQAQSNLPYIDSVIQKGLTADNKIGSFSIKFCLPNKPVSGLQKYKVWFTGDQVLQTTPIDFTHQLSVGCEESPPVSVSFNSSVTRSQLCSGGIPIRANVLHEGVQYNNEGATDAATCGPTLTPTATPTGPTLTPSPTMTPNPNAQCENLEFNTGSNGGTTSTGIVSRDLNVPGQVRWRLNGVEYLDKDKCLPSVNSNGDSITEYYCGPNGRAWATRLCSSSADPNSRRCMADADERGYCAGNIESITPSPTSTPNATPSATPTITLTPIPNTAPAKPTLISPIGTTATNQPARTVFKLKATDPDNDPLRYKIYICKTAGMEDDDCKEYEQPKTASQTAWSCGTTPEDSQQVTVGGTTYLACKSDKEMTFTLPEADKLAPGNWFWRAISIDSKESESDLSHETGQAFSVAPPIAATARFEYSFTRHQDGHTNYNCTVSWTGSANNVQGTEGADTECNWNVTESSATLEISPKNTTETISYDIRGLVCETASTCTGAHNPAGSVRSTGMIRCAWQYKQTGSRPQCSLITSQPSLTPGVSVTPSPIPTTTRFQMDINRFESTAPAFNCSATWTGAGQGATLSGGAANVVTCEKNITATSAILTLRMLANEPNVRYKVRAGTCVNSTSSICSSGVDIGEDLYINQGGNIQCTWSYTLQGSTPVCQAQTSSTAAPIRFGILRGAQAQAVAQYDLVPDKVFSIQDFRLATEKFCGAGSQKDCALHISRLITVMGYKLGQ